MASAFRRTGVIANVSGFGRSAMAVAVVRFAVSAFAANDVFHGTVNPELTTTEASMGLFCNPSSAPPNVEVPKDARVSEGSLRIFVQNAPPWQPGPWRLLPFLVIEPRNGRPFVFVDIDGNGAFSPDERFSFSHSRRPYIRGTGRDRASNGSRFAVRAVSIELALPDESYGPIVSRDRDRFCLSQSTAPLVTAKVRIDGRVLFFRYSIAADATSIDVRAGGYQAVDEGRLQRDRLSPLQGNGRGAPMVFRLGARYVSTEEVDLQRRKVVIRTRDASDYRRLELRPGLLVPDFAFDDIDGQSRRLSEFRGRYVLLNFWYTGCGPCLAEFPFLRDAEARFAARGLTILGLSESESPSEIRSLAEPSGTTWIEATSRSVYTLIAEWFRITGTPTQLLLQPSGQVIIVSPTDRHSPLRGEQLSKTLDRVLPLTPPAAR